MISTTVLKLAAENPALGHFLTLLCNYSELKANVHVAKTLVKCVLFIAMGPRDDKHLDQTTRARNRSQALRWAISRLEALKSDPLQSPSRFIDMPEYSPLAQGQMMTDLGFSQTTLSASIISALTTQLLLKLEKVDALALSNESALLSAAHDANFKAPRFSAQKYVNFRRSISLKCVPLLDNGTLIRPLLEQLILSPVRLMIPNSSSGHLQESRHHEMQTDSQSNESLECICGLSSELIDRLWANSATHFERLSKAAKTHLLHQCPASLSNEIARVIRLVNARPMANKTSIQGIAGNLIEAGFRHAPVFVHITSVLRQLILASMHPLIIRLFQFISEAVHSRLKSDQFERIVSSNFSLHWHSKLIHILSQAPQDLRQFKFINMALETSLGARIWTITSEQALEPPAIALTQKAWFNILGFPKWTDFAYSTLAKCNLDELGDESAAIEALRFLAFNAHPISHERREHAIEEMKLFIPRIRSMYESNKVRSDVLSESFEAHPLVHPFLLWSWDPSNTTSTAILCNIASETLTRNLPSITLDTIISFLESLRPSNDHGPIQVVARHIWKLIEANTLVSANKDVKLRIETLFS